MTTSQPDDNTPLVALVCEQCRGGFDLRVLEPMAVCPYCQHLQELPAALLAQSAMYAANVDAEQDRARFQALVADRYASLEPTAWLGLVVWGLFTLISLSGLSMAFFGRTGGVTVGGALTLLGLIAVLGTSAALTSLRNHKEKQEQASTSFKCICPSCGGGNQLAIGQTMAACGYCGIALVPGERLAAIGLGLAVALARASKLNAVAASRLFRLRAAHRNRVLRSFGAIVTPVLPAIISVYSYQQYQRGLGEWSQVMVAACGTLLLLAAPFAIGTFRHIVERPIRAVMGAIGSGPGSTKLAGVEGTICWLNALWLDEFGEYYDLQPGARYHALATTKRGFAVLVALCPGRYLHIAVAASGELPKLSHDVLKQFGFQVKTCQSGALFTLRGKALAAFGDPGQDQKLTRCIDAAVETVLLKGGRPAARC